MDFTSAVKKSVTNFMAGKMPEALNELKEGSLVFTPEYFDELEKELKDGPVLEEDISDEV